jgi:tryptophanyl-tRNA synthetase
LPADIDGLAGRPEAENLVGIYAALADESKADVLHRFGGSQFSVFKTALADLTVEKLAPIRSEILLLTADPGHIDSILADGADKARAIAKPNMDAIKDILGLIR